MPKIEKKRLLSPMQVKRAPLPSPPTSLVEVLTSFWWGHSQSWRIFERKPFQLQSPLPNLKVSEVAPPTAIYQPIKLQIKTVPNSAGNLAGWPRCGRRTRWPPYLGHRTSWISKNRQSAPRPRWPPGWSRYFCNSSSRSMMKSCGFWRRTNFKNYGHA